MYGFRKFYKVVKHQYSLMGKKSFKKKVTLSIDAKSYEEFQKYCKANAIMLSKKIELWIKDFLKRKK